MPSVWQSRIGFDIFILASRLYEGSVQDTLRQGMLHIVKASDIAQAARQEDITWG